MVRRASRRARRDSKSHQHARSLPTTAVGKIFKPRLVWNEIDFVTNAELDAFDERIAHRHVYTAAHSQLGSLTEVRVTAASGADPHQLERDIESSLGEYSFARRVVVAKPVDR